MWGPSLWCMHPYLGFLGIQQAETALEVHFWWLGALSNRNRPITNPHMHSSNMSMALSTWARRSSASKYPSWFFQPWTQCEPLCQSWLNKDQEIYGKMTNSFPSSLVKCPHSDVRKSEIMSDVPSPFLSGNAAWLLWTHHVFHSLLAKKDDLSWVTSMSQKCCLLEIGNPPAGFVSTPLWSHVYIQGSYSVNKCAMKSWQ